MFDDEVHQEERTHCEVYGHSFEEREDDGTRICVGCGVEWLDNDPLTREEVKEVRAILEKPHLYDEDAFRILYLAQRFKE